MLSITFALIFSLIPKIIYGDLVEDFDNIKTRESYISGNNVTKQYNSLANFLDFYNTEDLVKNLKIFSGNLSKLCEDDMKLYVNGLLNNEEWAMKSKFRFLTYYKDFFTKLKLKYFRIVRSFLFFKH